MGMLRTALALGALAVSVPLLAQNSRYGVNRSRVEERSSDGRGNRTEKQNDRRKEAPRGENRNNARPAPSAPDRGTGRVEARVGGGEYRGWDDRRNGGDRGDRARITVRPPVVVDRYDHRAGPRYDPRYDGRRDVRVMPRVYGGGRYRYGDRDFRSRDFAAISIWFRALPAARLAAYGYYGPGYGGIRYAFRPGLYLSMAVYMQLAPLPYDLELELGELPWYLERRIYGNTVLVIDTRTRLVVDLYDIDY